MTTSTHHSVRHPVETLSPSESLVQRPPGETLPLHTIQYHRAKVVRLVDGTFLVEPDSQAKGRVSCLVGLEDASITPLKKFDDSECLPNRTVLAGIMEGRVALFVCSVSLQMET